jgi:D-3-phosphoglycerate dehydrogenase / 2-oxoglutarate reductase
MIASYPFLTADQVKARGAKKVELDELLTQSDYVSVHCPLTKQSRKMMGAAQFARMKPEAYFITTARGFIHDEEALAGPSIKSRSPALVSMCGRTNHRRTIIRL